MNQRNLPIIIRFMFYILFAVSCALFVSGVSAQSENAPEEITSVRIKDITRISYIHDMQIHGYGLVVGLNGTGDSAGTAFTVQSVINMMQRFGIDVPAGKVSLRNVAAVIVTANLPFFSKAGDQIDVLVSSIGDASSISGGTLLPSPLCTSNGQLCVLAQGPISVGGFNVSAGGGNSTQKNHPTVGRVPNGGLLQNAPIRKDIPSESSEGLTLILSDPDFTTAARIVSAINKEFADSAAALDASAVKVNVPGSEKDLVAFVSRLENLMVVPDTQASVVVDERTGTIVVGKDVRIAPVAVSHGNLSIQIKTEEEASQPPPLSSGETVVISKKDMMVEEEDKGMKVIRGGADIEDVVKALNLIGVSPRDMIVILQAIKRAGGLHAKLIIM